MRYHVGSEGNGEVLQLRDVTADLDYAQVSRRKLYSRSSRWQELDPIGLQRSLGGTLEANLAAVGNAANTNEQTLKTFSIPANTLNVAVKGIRLRAWGGTAVNATTKTVRLYFGATVVISNSTTLSPSGVDWSMEAEVWRAGATLQEAIASSQFGEISQLVDRSAPVENTAAIIAAKITSQSGVGAAANDVVCNGFVVEYLY